ncbi:hypothetical protein CF326_g4860 [Tilletia indica]|nr:hypothetical protein CF326_g4860 [Tilletia indica]
MDFSQAQLKGFWLSYRRWRGEIKGLKGLSSAALAAEHAEYDADCSKLLKGCSFHFEQSATRARRNGSFVEVDDRDAFVKHVAILRDAKKEQDLLNGVNVFIKTFPRCEKWISWWVRCEIKSLIFPAAKKMSDRRWDELPTTTSTLENQHNLYYLQFEKKMDLVSGVQCLQAVAELAEDEHSAELEGKKTRYARAPTMAKKRRPEFVNDGRAPDTAETLSSRPSKKAKTGVGKSAAAAAGKNGGLGVGQVGVKGTAKVTEKPRVEKEEKVKKKVNRADIFTQPLPSTPSFASSQPLQSNSIASQLAVPSFTHENSTCYTTSTLECLWAVFVRLQKPWLALRDVMLPDGGIEILTNSLLAREAAYRLKAAASVRTALKKALNMVIEWVVKKELLWGSGQHGNSTWLYGRTGDVPRLSASLDLYSYIDNSSEEPHTIVGALVK